MKKRGRSLGEVLLAFLEKIRGKNFYRYGRVQSELQAFYPGRRGQEEARAYYCRKLTVTARVLIVGILIFLAFTVSSLVMGEDAVGALKRKLYDGKARNVTLSASTEDGYQTTVDVSVSSRIYTEEEAAARLSEELANMDARVKGANESLERVTEKLSLISEITPGPIEVEWEISDYHLLDYAGNLKYDALSESGSPVTIKGTLSYGDQSVMYAREIFLFPRALSEEEKLRKSLTEAVEAADARTETEETLILPDTLDGKAVTWSFPGNHTAAWLLALFLAVAILLYVSEDWKLRGRIEARKRQMALDYPKILNKLLLLMGSGMTIRAAWERIAEDYLKYGLEKRYAFEEVVLCRNDMRQGTPEAEAYDSFGRRCGTIPYLKLSSLLIQNLKKGARGLLKVFREEASEAFEERESYARRLGEEAGTKLLIPMMIMLAVVLIIVTVPAFMSMGV